MLVFAFFSFALAILTVRSSSVALVAMGALDFFFFSQAQYFAQAHTLILLSRQGTQAVVTCLRGAFFVLSGSGDMISRSC
jgi:hypothetical protein